MKPFDKDPSRDYTSPRRTPVALIAGLVIAIVIGIGAGAMAMTSGGGDDSKSSSESPRLASGQGPDVGPMQAPQAPTPEPTPEPPPPPTPVPEPAQVPQLTTLGSGDRLSIPKFGVNAPLTYKSVGPNGQMPDPDGSDDVAYYNFSNFPGFGGAPGKGGNAVFAGHVDSGSKRCDYGRTPPPCLAVLAKLAQVSMGDEITVQISGAPFTYRVTSSTSLSVGADWQSVVSATSKESITIITCGGVFNPRTREYDSRHVVKAERV
jgi:LPXTG-site transpeptidase (sortase) family protein